MWCRRRGTTSALEFLEIAKKIFADKAHLGDSEILLLWDYISAQLFYYTGKIIDGYIINNEENRAYIKK